MAKLLLLKRGHCFWRLFQSVVEVLPTLLKLLIIIVCSPRFDIGNFPCLFLITDGAALDFYYMFCYCPLFSQLSFPLHRYLVVACDLAVIG